MNFVVSEVMCKIGRKFSLSSLKFTNSMSISHKFSGIMAVIQFFYIIFRKIFFTNSAIIIFNMNFFICRELRKLSFFLVEFFG